MPKEKINYEKPWLSYSDQLEKLKSRGMAITDQTLALEYLERIGYYRLSGYWFAFRQRSGICSPLSTKEQHPTVKTGTLVLDSFKDGTTFKDVIDLYIFDKKLRLLLMDALERIEIALRVDVVHQLGESDPFAHLDAQRFHTSFSKKIDPKTGLTAHHTWINKHAQLVLRDKQDFVHHYKEKYGLPLPIWVASGIWDFGTLSTLFGGMLEVDQDKAAQKYGVQNGRIFASWLRSLNHLRNICAHHARLWNRNITEQPKLPDASEVPWVKLFIEDKHARARCFLLICITCHFLQRINPNSSWAKRMQEHLLAFPDLQHVELNLYGLGMPKNWEWCFPWK